jgi:hypothetical protein
MRKRKIRELAYIDEKANWHLGDSIIFFVLVCYLTYQSATFEGLIPGISNVSVLACLFVSVACLILWGRRGYRWVPAGAATWLVLIVIQKVAFSVKSGIPIDLATGIGGNSLLVIGSIFFIFRPNPLRIAKIIYVISILYILCYIYLSFNMAEPSFMVPADPTSETQKWTGILIADSTREARLSLSGSFAAFTLLCALGLIIYERKFIHIIPLVLSIWALYLAKSRTFSVILIFSVLMMFMSKTQISWLKRIGFGAFVLFVLAMGYGILDDTFNPYIPFRAVDDSGWARFVEYECARDIISNDPVFGTGIAPTLSVAYQFISNCQHVFAADDIGAIGIWTYFGFAGLIIFFILIYLSFFPGHHIDDFGWYSKVLHGIGFLNGLFGVLSPSLLLGDGCLFFAVVLYSAFYGAPRKKFPRGFSSEAQRVHEKRIGSEKKPGLCREADRAGAPPAIDHSRSGLKNILRAARRPAHLRELVHARIDRNIDR